MAMPVKRHQVRDGFKEMRNVEMVVKKCVGAESHVQLSGNGGHHAPHKRVRKYTLFPFEEFGEYPESRNREKNQWSYVIRACDDTLWVHCIGQLGAHGTQLYHY